MRLKRARTLAGSYGPPWHVGEDQAVILPVWGLSPRTVCRSRCCAERIHDHTRQGEGGAGAACQPRIRRRPLKILASRGPRWLLRLDAQVTRDANHPLDKLHVTFVTAWFF